MRSISLIVAAAALALAIVSCKSSSRQKGDCTYSLVLESESAGDMNVAKASLTRRLESFGFSPDDISIAQKGNTLELTFQNYANDENHEMTKMICATGGSLEFWEVYENSNEMMVLLGELDEIVAKKALKDTVRSVNVPDPVIDTTTLEGKLAAAGGMKMEQEGAALQYGKDHPLLSVLAPNFMDTENGVQALPGSTLAMAKASDTALVMQYLNMPEVKRKLPHDLVFVWSAKPSKLPAAAAGTSDNQMFELYALQRLNRSKGPAMSGFVIESSDVNSNQYGLSIHFMMDQVAAREWAKLTRKNINQSIALVMSGKVLSAPHVNDEIQGGACSITGDFNKEEAQTIAGAIKSQMPVSFKVVAEKLTCP